MCVLHFVIISEKNPWSLEKIEGLTPGGRGSSSICKVGTDRQTSGVGEDSHRDECIYMAATCENGGYALLYFLCLFHFNMDWQICDRGRWCTALSVNFPFSLCFRTCLIQNKFEYDDPKTLHMSYVDKLSVFQCIRQCICCIFCVSVFSVYTKFSRIADIQ